MPWGVFVTVRHSSEHERFVPPAGSRTDSFGDERLGVLPGSHAGTPGQIGVNRTLYALVEGEAPKQCLQLADHADKCAARGAPGHLEKVFGEWQPPPLWC